MVSATERTPYILFAGNTDDDDKCFNCMDSLSPPTVGHDDSNGNVIHLQHRDCAIKYLQEGFDECYCKTKIDPASLGISLETVNTAGRERLVEINWRLLNENFGPDILDHQNFDPDVPLFNDEAVKTWLLAMGFWHGLCFELVPTNMIVSSAVFSGLALTLGGGNIHRLRAAGLLQLCIPLYIYAKQSVFRILPVYNAMSLFLLSVSLDFDKPIKHRVAAYALTFFTAIFAHQSCEIDDCQSLLLKSYLWMGFSAIVGVFFTRVHRLFMIFDLRL